MTFTLALGTGPGLLAMVALILVGSVIGALPLWFAAKMVNAGRQGFVRSVVVQVVTMVIALAMIVVIGPVAWLFVPVIGWLALCIGFQVSLVRGLVLAIAWSALNTALGHAFGVLS